MMYKYGPSAVPGSPNGNRILAGDNAAMSAKLHLLQKRINEVLSDLVHPKSTMSAGKETLDKADDLYATFETLASYL